MHPDNPLIIQGDRTLLLHTVKAQLGEDGRPLKDERGYPISHEHPRYAEARDALAVFAELEKSPEYLHSYRISSISIWNAAAIGLTAEGIIETLEDLACVPIPQNVLVDIRDWVARYGLLRIERCEGEDGAQRFELTSGDREALESVLGFPSVAKLIEKQADGRVLLSELARGSLKQALIKIGFPVDDRGGYTEGDKFDIPLSTQTKDGKAFAIRDYQASAADAFHQGGAVTGGNGVIVLPCGAGKTIVGLAVMNRVGAKTLVLTTNTVAVSQWRNEILDKTDLTEDDVAEYTGDNKRVAPVTISTYQMLTWRKSKKAEFEHMALFSAHNWGLVVYDEVHLLPAPIFRVTADLQARRRLGLTATLIREDGKEDEVFCLIGPKRFEVPWKVLEGRGFIAEAHCTEVRVELEPALKPSYSSADARRKFRISSENPAKTGVIENLLKRHVGGRVMIIGQYIDQLNALARHLKVPLITGKTPNDVRNVLYADFRSGKEPVLIVSKVGNFAVDLPDANVLIQISGTFGSRQEEAQRLGRVLRPKSDGRGASFYAIVTHGTRDQDFAQKRQLFLAEQGYSYEIVDAASLEGEPCAELARPDDA
ncbi:MAG: DNA excision repair protein ERCC-3 [Planctomycetota bacterium]|jgi:DNA excision repair protein ERCC-3